MEQRLIEFIRALRAAGVRISLAESQDAMHGIETIGLYDPNRFRAALKTTLVKESSDHDLFDYFFPLFFSANTPPMTNIPDNLSADEQNMLQQALRSMMGQMGALRDLLQQMLEGELFSDQQLEDAARQAGMLNSASLSEHPWYERRMMQQTGLQQAKRLMEQLIEQLQEMGMGEDALKRLQDLMQGNMESLADQLSNFVGISMAQQMAQAPSIPKPDLMDVPFNRLGDGDIEQIREDVRRLAARLRSRASLRQKRTKAGKIDPRRTIRANMRYGGTPIELKRRSRHIKPSLVVICDVSTSVRYCTEFLLTLIYELQDQVARANSFIFISDLADISMAFKEFEPQAAVEKVMGENPPGYYNTDLGNSLHTFKQEHFGLLNSKTTAIILGDGRNNYNNPRLDIVEDMQRKARRLIWFCPEKESQWGTGDSDMHEYAPLADGVHYVNTLRDLANAVDSILADG
jgi:uncharacterized protein